MRLLLTSANCVSSVDAADGPTFDIEVHPRQSGQVGTMHAWLERDCAHGAVAKLVQTPIQTDQTSIVKYSIVDQNWCLSSLTPIACAPSVIGVSGLDNAAADDVAMAMSGRGPRPWLDPEKSAASISSVDLPSPALAAPANALFGARSKTNGYMRGSGTSGATAIVSGASALAIQAAALSGQHIDLNRLISSLIGTRRIPTDGNWRPDLGFGALHFDASSLFEPTPFMSRIPNIQQEVMRDERAVPSPN